MARWIIIALLLFPNIALGGVYVSGGVDPVEIGRRIAVSSPGVITLASGSVTRDNTKISAVDGTAFVDFSTANVLTDYVPYKGKLTITDSAGKKLVGYIKAAGTGETYGDECVTDGTFSNAGNWSAQAGWSVTGGAAVSADSTLYVYQTMSTLVRYGLYKNSMDIAITSGAAAFSIGGYGGLSSSIASSGSGVIRYVTDQHPTPLGGVLSVRLIGSIDNFSVKQVLTPSATGVTITSTPDGTTYNWESQESGFNYNAASGYTYAITTR